MFTIFEKCFQEASNIYNKMNLNKQLDKLSEKKASVCYILDMNVTDICFALIVSLSCLQILCNVIWENLTPGQKGLELTTIIISIVTITIIGLLATEFEKKIDQTMIKLKTEIANKNVVIYEKNNKIEKLEKIIDEYVEKTNLYLGYEYEYLQK